MEKNKLITPPVWSILLCGTPRRLQTSGPKVYAELIRQIEALKVVGIELIYLIDNKKRSVGNKRQWLLSMAQGEYISFVDDDDHPFETYCLDIYRELIKKPDAVTFVVNVTINGGKAKPCYYSTKYAKDANHKNHYERQINHLMVTKRDYAIKAGFPDKSMGEDNWYATRLKQFIKTEVNINKVLYHYDFRQLITETQ